MMEGGPSIQDCESSVVNSQENLVENEEQVPGGCYNLFCHPRGMLHRFIALVFMCFLGFGSYFCYDNPAALQDHLQDDLGISVTQYTMLYSIYSWPNVIMCFIGGFLLDRIFGIRLGTNIYMGITMLGQLCFTAGIYFNIYWIMVCGRFIFGIGAESLAVAQNSYAVLWFKGKELNMVFGLQLSFARIGSTVNFLVMEGIYNWVHESTTGPKGLGIVFLIASTTCLLSLGCGLILGVLDKRAERITQRTTEDSGEVIRLLDVLDFKLTFWLVTVICVSYYIAIFPFISLAKDFFIERFDMSKQDANSISSIVYLIAGFASPVLGFLIDKTGKNLLWICVAVISTLFSHALLAFTHVEPYVGMVIMGLAYSTLASSLWPLVSLMIPQYQLGTAYGVCQAVQNLGLAVASIVAGAIVDNFGYNILEIFFICCQLVALLTTFGLWLLDRIRKEQLNMTPAARIRHQQGLLAAEVVDKEQLLNSTVGIVATSSEESLGIENPDFEENSSPPVTAHI